MDSWGTDEGKFIRIFTQRSRPQLGATFPEYKKVTAWWYLLTFLQLNLDYGILFISVFIDLQLTNKDIADSIDAEMDGDLQKAFMTIGMEIKCIFIDKRKKVFILWIVMF